MSESSSGSLQDFFEKLPTLLAGLSPEDRVLVGVTVKQHFEPDLRPQRKQAEAAIETRLTLTRRPSVHRKVARDLGIIFKIANRYRQEGLEGFRSERRPEGGITPGQSELGAALLGESGNGPSTLPEFDAWCHRVAAEWAQRPEEWTIIRSSALYRLWLILLVGTLEACRVSYSLASRGKVPWTFWPDQGPAAEFIAWWSRPGVLAELQEPPNARLLVRYTIVLFHRLRLLGIEHRIRRCEYSDCGNFFLDSSRSYRKNPAKGCSSSHTTMARREHRKG